MDRSGDIHLLMTQLGHTSTTTAALYTNPGQKKSKKAAKQMGERRTNYREKNLKKEKISNLRLFSLRAHHNAKYSIVLPYRDTYHST